MRSSATFAAILAAAFSLPVMAANPTTAPATRPNNNRTTNNNRNTNTARTNNTRTTPARTPAGTPAALGQDTAANQEITTSKAALDQATSAYTAIIDRLTKEFEATPDMAAALQARADAATKLATLHPPLLEKAKASAEYQKITAEMEKNVQQLARLRENAAPDSEIAAAAQKLTDGDAAHDKVIKDAYAADKDCYLAQAQFDVADQKSNTLRAAFRKTLDSNDEVLKAKSEVTTARANFEDAKKRLSITSTP